MTILKNDAKQLKNKIIPIKNYELSWLGFRNLKY